MSGKELRTPRQAGRTYCADICKKYIDHMDRVNSNKDGLLLPKFKSKENQLIIADEYLMKETK